MKEKLLVATKFCLSPQKKKQKTAQITPRKKKIKRSDKVRA